MKPAQLITLLLLHHIEGVCKPLKTIKQATRAAISQVIGNIANGSTNRDREAAVQRAVNRRQAAIERARQRGAARRRQPSIGSGRRAVEAQRVLPGFIEQVHQYKERER